MAPYISGEKRNYVFGGICGIAANASIKVHISSFYIRSLVLIVQMSIYQIIILYLIFDHHFSKP